MLIAMGLFYANYIFPFKIHISIMDFIHRRLSFLVYKLNSITMQNNKDLIVKNIVSGLLTTDYQILIM